MNVNNTYAVNDKLINQCHSHYSLIYSLMHYTYSEMSVLLQGHRSLFVVAAATPFYVWPESLITATAF